MIGCPRGRSNHTAVKEFQSIRAAVRWGVCVCGHVFGGGGGGGGEWVHAKPHNRKGVNFTIQRTKKFALLAVSLKRKSRAINSESSEECCGGGFYQLKRNK